MWEQTNEQTDRQKTMQTDKQNDGQTKRHANGKTDRCTDKQLDGQNLQILIQILKGVFLAKMKRDYKDFILIL